MNLLHALCIAFSTYSKIPMPQVPWREENLRHSLCFFPLVGVVVGGLMLLWLWFCERIGIGVLLKGVIGACIPLLISGGIHMDGFMDTTDALASHKERAERLKILKDTHAGAFAVMGCTLYLLVFAGAISEAKISALPIVFVLSRALSALSLVTMPSASEGLLKVFASAAAKREVQIVMGLYIAIFGTLAVVFDPLPSLCGFGLLALCYLYYWRMSIGQFGGITGDLAGYFTQLSELLFILGFVVCGRAL